jgi:hypothetical protein
METGKFNNNVRENCEIMEIIKSLIIASSFDIRQQCMVLPIFENLC